MLLGRRVSGPDSHAEPFMSPNWSGYADVGGSSRFVSVSASWTVPKVAPGSKGDSATWVGIDGLENNDLVQAGTDQTATGYYAWYELLPQVAFSLGRVRPGNEVWVSVGRQASGTWSVTVEDITSGVVWHGPVAYDAAGTSAEWVEEAPTIAATGNVETLADYGQVRFSDMAVSGVGLAAAKAEPIQMVGGDSASKVVSYPKPYDAATDSVVLDYGPPPKQPLTYPLVTIGVAGAGSAGGSAKQLPPIPTPAMPAPRTHGYWLAGSDGGVFAFGSAPFYGSMAGTALAKPVTGIAATADHRGYWLVSGDGGVFAFGDARYAGSLPGLGIRAGPREAPGRHLLGRIVGIAASSAGGYWLVSSTGGVFSFGGAPFLGSCTPAMCPAPVVALVPDSGRDGYWLLLGNAMMVPFGGAPAITDPDCQQMAASGGLFATAATSTASGNGFWVALDNGSTCAEGDASRTSVWEAYDVTPPSDPAVALVADGEVAGSWLALAGGHVDRYGDAPRLGDLAGRRLAAPVVGAAGF